MTFKLERKSVGAVLTKFHVLDSTNSIVGSINVANEQSSDLQKHWRAPTGAPAATQSTAAAAIVAALRKGPKLTRQGILRGC